MYVISVQVRKYIKPMWESLQVMKKWCLLIYIKIINYMHKGYRNGSVYCYIKELHILSQSWRSKICDTTPLNIERDFKREIICLCIFFLINFLWWWKIIDDKPIITSSCLSYFFSLWMAGLFISSIKHEVPAGLYNIDIGNAILFALDILFFELIF